MVRRRARWRCAVPIASVFLGADVVRRLILRARADNSPVWGSRRGSAIEEGLIKDVADISIHAENWFRSTRNEKSAQNLVAGHRGGSREATPRGSWPRGHPAVGHVAAPPCARTASSAQSSGSSTTGRRCLAADLWRSRLGEIIARARRVLRDPDERSRVNRCRARVDPLGRGARQFEVISVPHAHPLREEISAASSRPAARWPSGVDKTATS